MDMFNTVGQWFLLLIIGFSLSKKVWRFRGFQDAMRGYHLLAEVLIRPVALGLILIETTILFLGLFGYAYWGFLAASLFFLYSAIILTSFFINGENFDCGCALITTHVEPPSPYVFVLRNAALIAIALFVVMTFNDSYSPVGQERIIIFLASIFFAGTYFLIEYLLSVSPAIYALSTKKESMQEVHNVPA